VIPAPTPTGTRTTTIAPTSTAIGAAGGALSAGERVQVRVPAGAVPADTVFAFASAPLPPTTGGMVPVAAFALTVSPPSASPFGRELTIEVPYDPAALAALGVDPASLVLVVVHPGGRPSSSRPRPTSSRAWSAPARPTSPRSRWCRTRPDPHP
jgi:hypothetical protein